jgi:uncharacterized protein involved in outer membrane biogenesis
MKRTKKIIAGVLLGLVLVMFLLVLWINRLAKVAVETAGTSALGVTTTVNGVDVGILTTSCTLSGLQVANPAGFKSDYFLKLSDGGIDVSVGSLIGDTVEVPRLALRGIKMNLVREHQQANYRTIIDNIARFQASRQTAEVDSSHKKFIFREVVIDDVEVKLDLLPLGGKLTELTVVIDQLQLENVGSEGNNGETLARVSAVVVRAVLDAVIEKGEDLVPPEVLGELRERLADVHPLEKLRTRIRDRAPPERRLKNRRLERKSRHEGIEA